MNLPSPSNTNSPNSPSSTSRSSILLDTTNQPMRNYDGTEMRDANSKIVYRSQFLSTHPLRADCKEKPGFGGKKFTYVTGDGVIRSMNAIFGHGGWSSQIVSEKCIQNEKDDRGRWWIGYLVTLRITLLNGSSHEDCGSGEGINPSKIQAHDKALKSAVTDAMKRAARHFGERLGNALYVKGSGIRTAPVTNREALEQLQRSDQLNLFGDQAALRDRCKVEENQHDVLSTYNPAASIAALNQPPTPVVSTAAPQLQKALSTAPSAMNQYDSCRPAAAPVQMQTNYNSARPASSSQSSGASSIILPSVAAQPKYNLNIPNRQVTNFANQNTNVTNIYNNKATMPPPGESRGVSPETTSGSSSDATKRNLPSTAVGDTLGRNSDADDNNKRQKRNPYSNSNNRLSC